MKDKLAALRKAVYEQGTPTALHFIELLDLLGTMNSELLTETRLTRRTIEKLRRDLDSRLIDPRDLDPRLAEQGYNDGHEWDNSNR